MMNTNSRLESAIERIRYSRVFTKNFLADLAPDDWFWSPQAVTIHIAWQVGHVAVAQYNMCLRRVPGRTVEDEALISDAFIDAFKAGSKPAASPSQNPTVGEIQQVFDGVYARALSELPTRTDAELDVPLDPPHPVLRAYNTMH